MLGSRQEIARLNSDFYRDQFHKILRGVMVSVMIIFLLIAALTYVIFFYQPSLQYYANTTDGKILNMPPAGV